jgi:hypothetical protein
MAILSQEVNRFLGNALLDPSLLKSILSGERARALQGFNLQPTECTTILLSQARTLPELSRELTVSCGLQNRVMETDVVIDRFYKSVHAGTKRTPIHMEAVAQSIINALPAQPVADGVTAAEKYANILAAS